MLNLTENQKAFCLFVWFMAAFGCAGQGDYEYAKSKEATPTITVQEPLCK